MASHERPILFSAPMVRAILEGRKTQTRRVVKLPHANPLGTWEPTTFGGKDARGIEHPEQAAVWHTRTGHTIGCHYGTGDRLWVRETFIHEPADYVWEASVSIPCRPASTVYRADVEGESRGAGWKPSIHMPRALSRIDLEVTGVRVERLQDISEADAIAEGLLQDEAGGWYSADVTGNFASPIEAFLALWGAVYGPDSLAANPWVWVIEFRRIRP